jgi:hypothetical protein
MRSDGLRWDYPVMHISDHDLERYYLGMVLEEVELAPLEEHLLCCSWCTERAEDIQDYVDAIRIALLEHGIQQGWCIPGRWLLPNCQAIKRRQ